jgi:hypothetical protein
LREHRGAGCRRIHADVAAALDRSVADTEDEPIRAAHIERIASGLGDHKIAAEVRISNAVRSADWIATEFANQNSPSTFYSILPENGNGIAPASTLLTSSQTQQFSAVFNVGAGPSRSNPPLLLGTAPTPSHAESLAVNGNIVYTCDDNEVSVIDISDVANPRFLSTAVSPSISLSVTGPINLPRRQVYGVTFFSSNSLTFVSYPRTDKAASVRPHLPISR